MLKKILKRARSVPKGECSELEGEVLALVEALEVYGDCKMWESRDSFGYYDGDEFLSHKYKTKDITGEPWIIAKEALGKLK